MIIDEIENLIYEFKVDQIYLKKRLMNWKIYLEENY